MPKPPQTKPVLEVRLQGAAVPGRVPVDVLTNLAKELQASLRRMMASPRRTGGRFPADVVASCSLELTAFSPGSAVLTFEYAGVRDRATLQGDQGVRITEEMLDMMGLVEASAPAWADSVAPSVIEGWDALAKSIGEGVDSIEIALIRDGRKTSAARLTQAFRRNLRGGAAVAEPQPHEGQLEGVLWECDWKQHTAHLEEADGNRVTLFLPEGVDERVTELRRQRVRVTGAVEHHSGRPVRMRVYDVTPADGSRSTVDQPYGGFWENLSADELARRQGVGPVSDLEALAGDWPADDSIDEFLDFVREVRGG